MRFKEMLCGCTIIVLLGGVVGCGDPAVPEENLTTIAPKASWVSGPAGLIVPESEDGPTESNPVPHGFSLTPQGAVLAAITAQSWMAGANDEVWPQVAEYLLEPGIGRDQWAQSRGLVSVEGTVEKPARFVAYKFTEYSNEKAIVLLVTQWPDGMLTVYPVQLSAASGQWRVVVPPQDKAPDMEEITNNDLTGFVIFADSNVQEEVG